MAADLEEELEVTRALLRQARADRDQLQRRLLQLEHKIRFLRRIPLLTTAAHARQRLRRSPTTRADPRPVPGYTGPLVPGRYLDATILEESARTGISRTLLRLAAELDYDPVAMVDGRLVHDVTWYREIHGRPAPGALRQRAGSPLVPGPGVTVLNGAIQLRDDFPAWQEQIRVLRSAGGAYVQIVHDLLPVTLPDFFHLGMRVRFPEWLTFVVATADLILTDSAATKADLRAWLADQAGLPAEVRARAGIEVCRLGSDALPKVASEPQRDPARPALLVVGTVEPRKAVDVVVAAAQQLRAGGMKLHLTVVGACGWADEALVAELHRLQSQGWLRWLQQADDRELAHCYAEHDLLVAASRGEGYGLPLAEAAAAGLPVVARDLPVFREILADQARYFRRDTQLADTIATALREPPVLSAAPRRSWRDAAQELDRLLDGLPR